MFSLFSVFVPVVENLSLVRSFATTVLGVVEDASGVVWSCFCRAISKAYCIFWVRSLELCQSVSVGDL